MWLLSNHPRPRIGAWSRSWSSERRPLIALLRWPRSFHHLRLQFVAWPARGLEKILTGGEDGFLLLPALNHGASVILDCFYPGIYACGKLDRHKRLKKTHSSPTSVFRCCVYVSILDWGFAKGYRHSFMLHASFLLFRVIIAILNVKLTKIVFENTFVRFTSQSIS